MYGNSSDNSTMSSSSCGSSVVLDSAIGSQQSRHHQMTSLPSSQSQQQCVSSQPSFAMPTILGIMGCQPTVRHVTESVEVPSSEHVAEIVGRNGCKIKALRAKTNTYIKTPVRGEEPVFVVTGREEDVMEAKREIECAADHFTQIRASRRHSQGGPAAPGQITAYVRVPLRVVGLVVGPKGNTIKRIQQDTHTYIITPSREREPIFEVTGLPLNVEAARREIENHIYQRTGNMPITNPANSLADYDVQTLVAQNYGYGLGVSSVAAHSLTGNDMMMGSTNVSIGGGSGNERRPLLGAIGENIFNCQNTEGNSLQSLFLGGGSGSNIGSSSFSSQLALEIAGSGNGGSNGRMFSANSEFPFQYRLRGCMPSYSNSTTLQQMIQQQQQQNHHGHHSSSQTLLAQNYGAGTSGPTFTGNDMMMGSTTASVCGGTGTVIGSERRPLFGAIGENIFNCQNTEERTAGGTTIGSSSFSSQLALDIAGTGSGGNSGRISSANSHDEGIGESPTYSFGKGLDLINSMFSIWSNPVSFEEFGAATGNVGEA